MGALERIQGGGVPESAEQRLAALRAWGGSTSFLSAGALAAGEELGLEPIGQLVGASSCLRLLGVVRTTRPGQGRSGVGRARWLERSGPVRSWTEVRRRAAERLTAQAAALGADAVIGVRARRREREGAVQTVELVLTGTAVRLRERRERPVLTLAGAQELVLLARMGLEPAGIAGAYARVETWAGSGDVEAMRRPWQSANVELRDLTEGVYEARRLAVRRLEAEARELGATGVLGVDMRDEDGDRGMWPALRVTIHVLASAVRRRGGGERRVAAAPVLDRRAGAGRRG
jgi:uncharacterized protein YbjQ (UPF0145 family)